MSFVLLWLFFRNLSDVLFEAISTRRVLSLYQGLGTKNLQSFIAQFIYFYGYSYFKRLYLEKSGSKSVGTKANLVLAAAAGACTAIVTQVRRESSFGSNRFLTESLVLDAYSRFSFSYRKCIWGSCFNFLRGKFLCVFFLKKSLKFSVIKWICYAI